MRGWRLRSERGSTTLWTLALAMSLLALGGISIDLWSALGAHRDLAGIADASAAAASSEIDQAAFRDAGQVQLDVDLATTRGLTVIGAQPNGSDLSRAPEIVVGVGEVTVTLYREVDFVLLQWLSGVQSIEVSAQARSDATLRQ